MPLDESSTFSDEARSLFPILDIAAAVPALEAPDHERAQLNGKFLQSRPSVDLLFYEIPSTQRSVSDIRLFIEQVKALVSLFKALGRTVVHALYAALIPTKATLNSKEEAKHYTSIHIWNWRAHGNE